MHDQVVGLITTTLYATTTLYVFCACWFAKRHRPSGRNWLLSSIQRVVSREIIIADSYP